MPAAPTFHPSMLLSPLARSSNLSLRSILESPAPATPSVACSPRRCRAAAAGALFAALSSPVQRLSPESRRSLEHARGGESLSVTELAALEAELEADLAKQSAVNSEPALTIAELQRRVAEADAALIQAGVTGAALVKEMEEMDEEYSADCERKDAVIQQQKQEVETLRAALASSELNAQAVRDELARQKDATDAVEEMLKAAQLRTAALEAEIKSMAGTRVQQAASSAAPSNGPEIDAERESWIITRTALEDRIESLTQALAVSKDEIAQSQTVLNNATSMAQDLALATPAFQAAEASIATLQAAAKARSVEIDSLREELIATQIRAQTADQASTLVLARLNQRIAELEEAAPSPSVTQPALSECQIVINALEAIGMPLAKLHMTTAELAELSMDGLVQLVKTIMPTATVVNPVCTPAEAVVSAQNETDALLREIAQSVAQSLTVQASARKTRRSSSMSAIGMTPLAVLRHDSAQVVPLCSEISPVKPASNLAAAPAQSDLLREYFHLSTLLLKLSPNALVSDPSEEDLAEAFEDAENVDPLSSPCASPVEKKPTSNIRAANYSAHKLWEECQSAAVPFEQWHPWIKKRLEEEAAQADSKERLRPRTPAGSKFNSNTATPATRSRASSIGAQTVVPLSLMSSSFTTPLAAPSTSASQAYAQHALTPIHIGNLSKIVVEPSSASTRAASGKPALGENSRINNSMAQQQRQSTPSAKSQAPASHRPVVRGATSDRFNQRQGANGPAQAPRTNTRPSNQPKSSPVKSTAAESSANAAAASTPSRSLLGKFANFVTASPAPRAPSPNIHRHVR